MIYENGTVYVNDVELTYVVQKTMNAVSKIPCTEVDAYFLNTSRKIMYNVAWPSQLYTFIAGSQIVWHFVKK